MKTISLFLDAVDSLRLPWWLWPTFLVVLAVSSVGASLFFRPLGTEWVAWPWGGQLGDTCGMIVLTGLPCPQCGMTRSWVHGIRGDLTAAFWFSPAGLALLGWIVAGGVVGAVRLATRDPDRWSPNNLVLFGWILFWLIPLYTLPYVARLAGYNPLP